MKTIYNKIFFIICSFFILPFLGGGVLNAQSEELLNDSWSFIEGNINEEELQLPANFGGGFFNDYFGNPFFEFIYSTTTSQCYGFNITYFDVSNNQFFLDEIIDIQPNDCQGGEVLDFINKHNSFFVHLPIDTNGTQKNPFNYTIVNMGNQDELTITNNEGDWVKYGGGILSNTTFHQNSFIIYPNPVKEVLQVNNSSNQPVSAIIYDIHGKKLQTHSIENNLSTIYVKALKQGMYFVVFENENGERVSKKFVKK